MVSSPINGQPACQFVRLMCQPDQHPRHGRLYPYEGAVHRPGGRIIVLSAAVAIAAAARYQPDVTTARAAPLNEGLARF